MSKAPSIRRGSSPRKGVTVRKQANSKRRSRIDRIIGALPIREETLRRIATWTIVGAAVLVLGGMATWAGVPGAVGVAAAEAVGRAGFRAEQVEVTGLKRMDRLTVYAVALDQKSRAMPLVDLEGVRTRLLSYGWVADAQVSRRLPDTLLVHIVERRPAAVWQNAGQLMLIDKDGVVLEQVALDAMPDLPLVIGPGADKQATGLARLLERAPGLKPMVSAATWVGDRRWNLRFQSGEELMLPEGDTEASAALAKFVDMDRKQRLLDRGFVRFDMRDSRKVYALPSRDGGKRAITEMDPEYTETAMGSANG